jgi:hypothetical protein
MSGIITSAGSGVLVNATSTPGPCCSANATGFFLFCRHLLRQSPGIERCRPPSFDVRAGSSRLYTLKHSEALKFWETKSPSRFRRRVAPRFPRNRLHQITIRSRKPGPLQSFRFVTSLDHQALCQFARRAGETSEKAVNVIDCGWNGSAEFSDLYLRLLSAALDETNSSLSPWMREFNLAAHVARGMSMAEVVPQSFRHPG